MENKKKYRKKCHQRVVTFHLCDNEIYEFSKTINFTKFVKNCLKKKLGDKK